MGDVIVDALLDSLKVLAVVIVIYIALSFVEDKLSRLLEKDKKLSPLIGAGLGLVPQCGLSVVASDLYIKRHISMGTLLAIFIACSDEALPIILAQPNKALMVLPLLGVKFLVGFVVGYLVDFFIVKIEKKDEVEHGLKEEEIDEVHIGCCHHEIDNQEEGKWHKHLIHPLIHSLKIFAYVLVINLIFGIIIHYVGEDNIASFLQANKYLSPLYSTLIGLIPNCASSVIITKLYVMNEISFGACLSGLIVNAGLGLTILVKNKAEWKHTLAIISILVFTGLAVGYICCGIFGF